MNRWKAFGIHLAISAAIGCAAALVVGWVWYPPPLLQATESDVFLYVLVGIDVVIGPLLTLVVFRPGKPSLRFDLAVIALLQLAMLSYGLWTAVSSRPVFLVEGVDRVTLVRANHVEPSDLEAAARNGLGFHRLSWTGPVLVGSKPPHSVAERNRLMLEELKGGLAIELRPQYYVDFGDRAEALFARGHPLPPLYTRAPKAMAEITAIAERAGERIDDLRFVPLVTGREDVAVILSGKTRRPVGMVRVNPWPK